MQTVLFRADGNAASGAGHVMRCLALAQAVHDSGGTAVFLSHDLPEEFRKRLERDAMVLELRAEPCSSADAEETALASDARQAAWVVLDGYGFGDAYVTALQSAGKKVLRIDDHSHLPRYSADITLNQNAHATRDLYPRVGASSTLLLGTAYALLRREYRQAQPKDDTPPQANALLLTFGGSDPTQGTPFVIRALKGLDLRLTVVVGGGNLHVEEVRKAVSEAGLPATLAVNAENMPALMRDADFAITAAGSTCYELAYMGVPMIAIIVAENQEGVATGLAGRGGAVNLGWQEELGEERIRETVTRLRQDRQLRVQLQQASKRIVDGNGALRVWMTMTGNPFYLRRASHDDCKRVFAWANDQATRAASFSSDPIPWETHTRWFANKLADPHHVFFIAVSVNEEPIGQVRFACEGEEAVISLSIAPEMRGKKYGTPLVAEACRRLWRETRAQRVEAYIKPENEASRAVFSKAGFREAGPTTVQGHLALHFHLSRP